MAITKEVEERLNRDIKATQSLMIRNSTDYGLKQSLLGDSPFIEENRYEGLYTNATEDMATYYNAFKNTESVLTIGASGEQVANAINSGAKIIDVYDSNRLCRYAVHLRLAAIQALTLDELFEYYKTFSPFLFVKISKYLPEEQLMYWGTLYSMFGEKSTQGGKAIEKLLFTYKRFAIELNK